MIYGKFTLDLFKSPCVMRALFVGCKLCWCNDGDKKWKHNRSRKKIVSRPWGRVFYTHYFVLQNKHEINEVWKLYNIGRAGTFFVTFAQIRDTEYPWNFSSLCMLLVVSSNEQCSNFLVLEYRSWYCFVAVSFNQLGPLSMPGCVQELARFLLYLKPISCILWLEECLQVDEQTDMLRPIQDLI